MFWAIFVHFWLHTKKMNSTRVSAPHEAADPCPLAHSCAAHVAKATWAARAVAASVLGVPDKHAAVPVRYMLELERVAPARRELC